MHQPSPCCSTAFVPLSERQSQDSRRQKRLPLFAIVPNVRRALIFAKHANNGTPRYLRIPEMEPDSGGEQEDQNAALRRFISMNSRPADCRHVATRLRAYHPSFDRHAPCVHTPADAAMPLMREPNRRAAHITPNHHIETFIPRHAHRPYTAPLPSHAPFFLPRPRFMLPSLVATCRRHRRYQRSSPRGSQRRHGVLPDVGNSVLCPAATNAIDRH